MKILSRKLHLFGVELVWDGKHVVSLFNGKGKKIEMYPANNLVAATRIMGELEEEYHFACRVCQ